MRLSISVYSIYLSFFLRMISGIFYLEIPGLVPGTQYSNLNITWYPLKFAIRNNFRSCIENHTLQIIMNIINFHIQTNYKTQKSRITYKYVNVNPLKFYRYLF